MIWEMVIFAVSCCVTIFAFWRKPKVSVPREFELVENEIKKWLETPFRPLGLERVSTADTLKLDKIIGEGLVDAGAYGTYGASGQLIENEERLDYLA